jgi:NAD(P)-dependent dehydrogenase (short-subunit alcohol dehydrogenase family)
VTSLDDVKRMVQKCLDKFGKIDILVNSAGRWSPSEYTYPMYDLPEKDWYSVMDVNVTGTFLCSKYVAKQMIKQGNGGKIVNMGSTASKYVRHRIGGIGETIGLGGAYTTSKHAVVGLTRSLAMQLAPYKINVNCVCPTTCDTPLNKRYYEVVAKTKETTPEEVERAVAADHPLGRTLRAGEVAQLILFLCSEDAAMMTAEDVNLSGGIVYW